MKNDDKNEDYIDIGKSNMLGDTIPSNNKYKDEINQKINENMLKQLDESYDDTYNESFNESYDESYDNIESNNTNNKGYTKKRVPAKKPARDKRKPSYNSMDSGQKSSFYIYALISCVVVCIVVMVVVFNITIKNNKKTPDPSATAITDNQTDNQNNIIADNEELITSTGLVENISNSGAIQIYDLYENRDYNLKYVNKTTLKDEFDKPLIIDEIKMGQIIDYQYAKGSTSLSSITLSKKAFYEKRVTGIKNDDLSKTYTKGDKTYFYDENTIVDFDRGVYNAEQITDKDIVNIRGFEKNIYYVEVVKGHGTLKVTNNFDIQNPSIEIDTTIIDSIKDVPEKDYILQEGPHKIVVKGDNIDPYITDIMIEANDVSELSLMYAQSKKGLFVPNITPYDADLYIDGEIVNRNEPIMLDYGPHTVRVSKNGFDEYMDTITIKGSETRINIALNGKVLMSKLTITTDPVGAGVYVDNAYIGTSPCTTPVEYGQHTIIVKMDGYVEISYALNLEKKEEQIFFNLQKKDTTEAIPTVNP